LSTEAEIRYNIQRTYKKLYRLQHKNEPEYIEKESIRLRKYYQTHTVYVKKRNKEYYEKNRDKIVARVKKYRTKGYWLNDGIRTKLTDIENL